MPTVLDEFVLQIGWDSAGFRESRRQIDEELTRGQRSIEAFGRNVEQTGTKIGEAFSFIKRGAAGIVATFVGAEAAQFIDRLATMDAHTGRLARSIGITTRELSVWQNMMRTVGASPQGANAMLGGITDTLFGIGTLGQVPSPMFQRLMTISGVTPQTPPDVAMRQIMQSLQNQSPTMQRQLLRSIPGMDEGDMLGIMQLLQDPNLMRNLREQIEKIGTASDTSAKQGQELEKQTGLLHTALERLGREALLPLVQIATQLTEALMGVAPLFSSIAKLFGYVGAAHIDPGDPARLLGQWLGISSAGALASFPKQTEPGSASPSRAEVEAKTRQIATEMGINPNVAAGVFRGESGFDVNAKGDRNFLGVPTSFGVAQLHRGALADVYESTTGHAANDPRYWEEQLRFSMMWAKTHRGWTDWHAHQGDPWEGIKGAGAGTTGGKQSSVTIGTINVTSNEADPKKVADQIPQAMQRYAMLAGANTGLV